MNSDPDITVADPTMTPAAVHRHLHPSERFQLQWSKENLDALEPLLSKNIRRFVLFPIKYTAIWRAYKHVVSTFWIADSIDGRKDADEWEKTCINTDKRVVSTLLLLFEATHRTHEKPFYDVSTTITSPEARCFFGFQAMIENVHREALATMASTLIPQQDVDEEAPVSIARMNSLERKLLWVKKQSEDDTYLFSEKLLLLLFVQGLFSSSATTVVKWLADKGVLPGFVYTYNRTTVDREAHINFACLLFYHLERRPPAKFAESLVAEIVELERSFAEELIRNLDANIPLYPVLREVECTADGLLTSVGYKPIYSMTENKDDVDRKVTGGLKALYFQHEMANAYAHSTSSRNSTEEELTFDFTDQQFQSVES